MANYTSDEVLDPKGAVKLLNQLIIDEFDLKLPRHSYTQSYFTEKLGMSNEEATQRAEFSKKTLPNRSIFEPPVCEEVDDPVGSILIVSDPSSALVTPYKGRFYNYPVEFELYRHIAKKIAENNGLKSTETIVTDDEKGTLSLHYKFMSNEEIPSAD